MTYLTDRETADGAGTQPAQWTEPPPSVWRARCLLATSILNQRATADGLSRDDAAAVAGALVGVWNTP
jgi:hypothetical protein